MRAHMRANDNNWRNLLVGIHSFDDTSSSRQYGSADTCSQRAKINQCNFAATRAAFGFAVYVMDKPTHNSDSVGESVSKFVVKYHRWKCRYDTCLKTLQC